ncbi:hypothetical protein RRG08_031473 [Elysia crispata]|uniref:Uncharacterized protein n=1 Tax=Elysia crispata TaxID=231223 RepID=A0AAE1DIY6_9GAST|nr:hypothetical protein RRG08_031473 [Elysia crispata]
MVRNFEFDPRPDPVLVGLHAIKLATSTAGSSARLHAIKLAHPRPDPVLVGLHVIQLVTSTAGSSAGRVACHRVSHIHGRILCCTSVTCGVGGPGEGGIIEPLGGQKSSSSGRNLSKHGRALEK